MSWLKVYVVAAVALVASLHNVSDARAQASLAQRTNGAEVVLLGTSGGPTWWTNSDRAGISSAVIVNGSVYLVDVGQGASKRLQEALKPPNNFKTIDNLKAVFVTHLHSDHIADYPALLLFGLFSGLDRRAAAPLQIFGPGRRGELEPVFSPPGRSRPEPVVANPRNPTPGIEDLTAAINEGFANDLNDRIRDNGKPDLQQVVKVHDIVLPPIAGFNSPNTTPHPDMEPFLVYQDENVKVSATLVDHAPVFPAFAYRFDMPDGSVVFSGDTAPSANLVKLAKGADVLVHEVIVESWIDRMLPAPRSSADEGLRQHLLRAHTTVAQLGKIAEESGVRTLVLSHIVPANASDDDLLPAQNGFRGKLVIGKDLLRIDLKRPSN